MRRNPYETVPPHLSAYLAGKLSMGRSMARLDADIEERRRLALLPREPGPIHEAVSDKLAKRLKIFLRANSNNLTMGKEVEIQYPDMEELQKTVREHKTKEAAKNGPVPATDQEAEPAAAVSRAPHRRGTGRVRLGNGRALAPIQNDPEIITKRTTRSRRPVVSDPKVLSKGVLREVITLGDSDDAESENEESGDSNANVPANDGDAARETEDQMGFPIVLEAPEPPLSAQRDQNDLQLRQERHESESASRTRRSQTPAGPPAQREGSGLASSRFSTPRFRRSMTPAAALAQNQPQNRQEREGSGLASSLSSTPRNQNSPTPAAPLAQNQLQSRLERHESESAPRTRRSQTPAAPPAQREGSATPADPLAQNQPQNRQDREGSQPSSSSQSSTPRTLRPRVPAVEPVKNKSAPAAKKSRSSKGSEAVARNESQKAINPKAPGRASRGSSEDPQVKKATRPATKNQQEKTEKKQPSNQTKPSRDPSPEVFMCNIVFPAGTAADQKAHNAAKAKERLEWSKARAVKDQVEEWGEKDDLASANQEPMEQAPVAQIPRTPRNRGNGSQKSTGSSASKKSAAKKKAEPYVVPETGAKRGRGRPKKKQSKPRVLPEEPEEQDEEPDEANQNNGAANGNVDPSEEEREQARGGDDEDVDMDTNMEDVHLEDTLEEPDKNTPGPSTSNRNLRTRKRQSYGLETKAPKRNCPPPPIRFLGDADREVTSYIVDGHRLFINLAGEVTINDNDLMEEDCTLEEAEKNYKKIKYVDHKPDDVIPHGKVPTRFSKYLKITRRAHELSDSHALRHPGNPEKSWLDSMLEEETKLSDLSEMISKIRDFPFSEKDLEIVWDTTAMSQAARNIWPTRYLQLHVYMAKEMIRQNRMDYLEGQWTAQWDDPMKFVKELTEQCDGFIMNDASVEHFNDRDLVSLVDVIERNEKTEQLFVEFAEVFPNKSPDLRKFMTSCNTFHRFERLLREKGFQMAQTLQHLLEMVHSKYMPRGGMYLKFLLNVAYHFQYRKSTEQWEMVVFAEKTLFKGIEFNQTGEPIEIKPPPNIHDRLEAESNKKNTKK